MDRAPLKPETPPLNNDKSASAWDEGAGGDAWRPVYAVEGMLLPEGTPVKWGHNSMGAEQGFFRTQELVQDYIRQHGFVPAIVLELWEMDNGQGYYNSKQRKQLYKPLFVPVDHRDAYDAKAPDAGDSEAKATFDDGTVVEAEVVDTAPAKPVTRPRRARKVT